MIHNRTSIQTAVILLFILFPFLFSCHNGKETDSEQLLEKAEKLLDEHPDSALTLLQSFDATAIPDKSGRIRYNFLLIQAKDRNLIDMSEDSVKLKEALDYYVRRDDPAKTAWAYYYRGRLCRRNNQPQEAIAYSLKAIEQARLADDPLMLAYIYHDIGKLYQQEGNFNEALKNYRLSQTCFRQAGDEKNACLVYKFIGTAYLYMAPMQADSAIVSYRKALDCAMSACDSFEIAVLNKNISLAYGEKGDKASEKTYMLRALQYSTDNDILAVVQRMLAEIYANANQPDSAALFMNGLMENPAAHRKMDDRYYNHLMLYRMYKKFGNPSLALAHHEKASVLSDSIQRYKTDQSVLEIQRKYDLQAVENQYHRVVIQRLVLAIAVIAVILSGVLIAWLLIHRIRRKETELAEAQQALRAFGGTIAQQDNQLQYYGGEISKRDEQLHLYNELLAERTEQLEDYDRLLSERNEKDERLRAILMDRLDITRKVAQMNVVATENTRTFMAQFHKVFGKNLLDWEHIRPAINELYGGFVDKLSAAYPDLSDKDLQLCCFIRAGFRTEELAVLLDMTQSSVQVKRTRLAKRMGFDSAKAFLSYLAGL